MRESGVARAQQRVGEAAPPIESRDAPRRGMAWRCLMKQAWEEAWGWLIGGYGRKGLGGGWLEGQA